MAMDGSKLCSIVILIVAVALAIYGFILMLRKPSSSMTQVQGVQEQIKGFGMILLGNFVLAVGLMLCMSPYLLQM